MSEAEYRYDPSEDGGWYPPVACTLSEYALLSAGVNPHKYIVLLAFIEAEDRMRSAVFPWATVDGTISERNRLLMDGREKLAGIRHEHLRDAVLQGLIPVADAYRGAYEHLQKFPFTVLKKFAEERGWDFRGDQPQATEGGADERSLVSRLIEHLDARDHAHALPRFVVLLEAYREIYEQHPNPETLVISEREGIIRDICRRRYGENHLPAPLEHLVFMLKTTQDSLPGRRRTRR